jgi:hydroxymethylbilane synthase
MPESYTLRLGTRGSQLALFQAHSVADLLRDRAGVACEIVVIKTSGDRLAEASLSEIGGKRLFVKEIEDALLSREIDLAVHSSKDMPAVLPDGLQLGAVLPREDPRDAVVLPDGEGSSLTLDDLVKRLGRGPRIGTSSIRRTAQLIRLFPGAQFQPVRGNLGTRLAKVDARRDFDALVLAAAGLKRLRHEARISATLPIEACVPAPGQGIIAVEVRDGDARALEPLTLISDPQATAALTAERAVVTRLGGGCQMPIGAFAALHDGELALTAVVISVDGSQVARTDMRGPTADARAVGIRVAEELLARGAGEILARVHREHGAVEGLQP